MHVGITSHISLKGAWETKISNREKRQQRKKEKGPNDESGSPGRGQQTEHPAVPAPVNTKKNKGKQFEATALNSNGLPSVHTGALTYSIVCNVFLREQF